MSLLRRRDGNVPGDARSPGTFQVLAAVSREVGALSIDVGGGPGDGGVDLEGVVEGKTEVVTRAGDDAGVDARARRVVRRLLRGDHGAGGAVEGAAVRRR